MIISRSKREVMIGNETALVPVYGPARFVRPYSQCDRATHGNASSNVFVYPFGTVGKVFLSQVCLPTRAIAPTSGVAQTDTVAFCLDNFIFIFFSLFHIVDRTLSLLHSFAQHIA